MQKWAEEVKKAENKAEILNQQELEAFYNMPTTDPYAGYVARAAEPRPNNRGFYKRDYYRGNRNNNQRQNTGWRQTAVTQQGAPMVAQGVPVVPHAPPVISSGAPIVPQVHSQIQHPVNPVPVNPWTTNMGNTLLAPSSQINTSIFHTPGHC